MISRCQYSSNLGGVGFVFEPQPGASERGDHLPKHLAPGAEAVLVHNWATMRIFLNQVLLDYELEEATFQIVLTLGNGKEVVVSPSMHVEADMCEHELAADLTSLGGTLVRQELAEPSTLPGLTTKGWQWWRRANWEFEQTRDEIMPGQRRHGRHLDLTLSAPSRIRTCDLLLRRRFWQVAGRCLAWPDVPSGCIDDG